jgi:hypothetical protein
MYGRKTITMLPVLSCLVPSIVAPGIHAGPIPLSPDRPRYIVLTDISGDPDDQQSLTRLMVYANMFDIEAICVSPFNDKMDAGMSVARDVIARYGKDRPNLIKHADGYPTEEYLLSVLKPGHTQGNYVYMGGNSYWDHIGEGKDTPASERIVEVLQEDDPRPVCFGAWGGPVNLAQALWKIQNTFSAEKAAELKKKVRLYDIATQDVTFNYIKERHGDIFYLKAQTVWIGWFKRDCPGNSQIVSLDWANANIKGHGALGEGYPTWTGPEGVKEGDTPSFMYYLRNGLSDFEHPDWGCWAGRFRKAPELGPGFWLDDASNWGPAPAQDWIRMCATVYRWREHYQPDFQARMDWCVRDFGGANHNPVAGCNGWFTRDVVLMDVAPGQTVELDAEGSYDPDGDELSYLWWHYNEADRENAVSGGVTISDERSPKASFVAPNQLGKRVHVILEVTDNGSPNLKSYKRIVCTITDNPQPLSVATPSIAADPDSNEFGDSVGIILSCTTPGAEVFYTLDGTVPTEASTAYSMPFTLGETTTIKVRAFKDGMEPSAIVAQEFVKKTGGQSATVRAVKNPFQIRHRPASRRLITLNGRSVRLKPGMPGGVGREKALVRGAGLVQQDGRMRKILSVR